MHRILALAVGLSTGLVFASPAHAAPAVDGEFAIAGGVGTDNDIVQGPDGNMWVTLQNDNGVARITPAGVVTEFALPNTAFGIAVGPDNNLWVSTVIGVAKFPASDPTNETVYDVGIQNGRGIIAGPDGRLYVAAQGEVVSFTPGDPENTWIQRTIADLQPHGVTVGSDGLVWVADGSGKVISVTATPSLTPAVYDIQINAAGGAQDVAAGPNGQVAYAAPTTDPQTVGRITPGGTPAKTELTASDPFGVTFAPDGAYWVARSQTNDLLRLTPDGQTSTLTGFAASGGVGPRKIAPGPGGTLWVTLDTPEKVARVTGVVAPAPVAPETAIDKHPKKKVSTKGKAKAKVKFKFSSTTPGAVFECSLRPKAKQPTYKPCTSPAKFKVKPKKYRFFVRAVVAGVADPTPASFRFKVVRSG